MSSGWIDAIIAIVLILIVVGLAIILLIGLSPINPFFAVVGAIGLLLVGIYLIFRIIANRD